MDKSTTKKPIHAKSGIFYGYWILAVAFFYLLIYSGLGVGAFSLFVQRFQSEFGWGRGSIMGAFTLYFIVTGAASPFVGRFIDRYGVRGVVTAGALITGLAFISLTQLQGLWHLYAAYTAIGVGMAAFGPVPASTLVSNWFNRRRGFVIGIMSAGIGSGILVIAPLLSGLVIPLFQWRAAYLTLAFLACLPILLTLLFVKTRPEEMGLHPDGIDEQQHAINGSLKIELRGLSLKEALRTPAFWLLSASFFLAGFTCMGITQNQVPHLQDIGFPLVKAAAALTGLGIGSAVGKFLVGWLCDYIPAKFAWIISLLLLIISIIILMNLTATSSMLVIWLYALIYGLGNGGWLPTMSVLANVNFGMASYGVIFGMISFAQAIGCALGPLTAGYLYDVMGTYRWAFILFLLVCVLGIAATLLVRRPRKMS